MILIDAVYINKGGGKILLDLLIENIRKQDMPAFLLLDQRIENEYAGCENVKFIKASLINRHRFYKVNGKDFSVVLAFANVPPTIRLNCTVYTFFQNVLLLTTPFRLRPAQLMSWLKGRLIRYMAANTDYWIVQSQIVAEIVTGSVKLKPGAALILPFYRDAPHTTQRSTQADAGTARFLYVSSGEPHKNHQRLFKAFAVYNKKYPLSSLTVTLADEYKSLCDTIDEMQQQGIRIVNRRFMSQDELVQVYHDTDVCIFPSLKESFGLGLIEAAQRGMPVIASDLEYVRQAIVPSAVFNPFSEEDILRVMTDTNAYLFTPAKIVAANSLNEILNLLHEQK